MIKILLISIFGLLLISGCSSTKDSLSKENLDQVTNTAIVGNTANTAKDSTTSLPFLQKNTVDPEKKGNDNLQNLQENEILIKPQQDYYPENDIIFEGQKVIEIATVDKSSAQEVAEAVGCNYYTSPKNQTAEQLAAKLAPLATEDLTKELNNLRMHDFPAMAASLVESQELEPLHWKITCLKAFDADYNVHNNTTYEPQIHDIIVLLEKRGSNYYAKDLDIGFWVVADAYKP